MRSPGDNIDHPYCIKTAFMGCAAANIGGQTCHSSFSLDFGANFMTIGDQKRALMQTILCLLRVVIIDEFSMLKADMLYLIDIRLRQITQRTHLPFGGVKGSGNGTRESGIWVIEAYSYWHAVNDELSGKLQLAQMDVDEIEMVEAEVDFSILS